MRPNDAQAMSINNMLVQVMMETWGSIPTDEEMAMRGSVEFNLPQEGMGQLIYSWDEQPLVTFTYLLKEDSQGLAIHKHK